MPSLSIEPVVAQVVLAIVLGAIGLAGYVRYLLRKTRTTATKRLSFALAALVCALLALALLRPALSWHSEAHTWESVFLVDISASAQRLDSDDKQRTREWIERFVAAAPRRAGGVASVIAFGRNAASMARERPVSELWDLSALATVGTGIDVDGTDLAAAFDAVAANLSPTRATSVILVSDGLATQGDTLTAARRLGRRGIPIHVLPVTSLPAGAAIEAADLPTEARMRGTTYLRAVLANPTAQPAQVSIDLKADGVTSLGGPLTLMPGARTRLRKELSYQRPGLHYADLSITAANTVQTKRFFNYVTGPAKVMVVGGAGRWRRALDPAAYEVSNVSPGTELDLIQQDVLILDGVGADELAPGQVDRIASAVASKALGLMLVNGEHPLPDTVATVSMGYEETSLDRWLPTTSKPRPEQIDPPGREIIIVIDASGSMQGWKLVKANAIAARIISQLKEKDHLQLIVFRDEATVPISAKMTAANRSRALSLLPTAASGGTQPISAVERSTATGRCGLFFISDIEFSETLRSHACAATVFAVGPSSTNFGQVAALGELHVVQQGFGEGQVSLGFFVDEPRKKFFERGQFRPDWLVGMNLFDPELPISGNAIGFPRADAQIAFSRPYPDDPVLVFSNKKGTRVASLLTALPEQWVGDAGGRRAVDQWLRRLLPWSERQRYWIESTVRRGELEVAVTPRNPDGSAVAVHDIEMQLKLHDGRLLSLRTRRQDNRSFAGRTGAAARMTAGWGTLMLKEIGSNAVPQVQEIPMFIPALTRDSSNRGDTEARTSGIDEALLQRIAVASNGVYAPEVNRVIPWQMARPRSEWALWLPLVFLAAVTLVVLVFLERNYA